MSGRYRVQVKRSVQKDIARLHPTVAKRIGDAIKALADDPRPDGVKKGKGNVDWYRIRVGDYRVIYTIADDRLLVTVIAAGARGGIYD